MFGLVLMSGKRYRTMVKDQKEIADSYRDALQDWRKSVRFWQGIRVKADERIGRLEHNLKASEYNFEKKTRTILEKNKLIDKLRDLIDGLVAEKEEIVCDFERRAEEGAKIWGFAVQREKEYHKQIKNLEQKVRYRDKVMATLRAGIDIPAEVQKEREKNIKLIRRNAEMRSEIYQITKQLKVAQEYIQKYLKAEK